MPELSRRDVPPVVITEASAQAAYALEQRIKDTIRVTRETWVDLARDLYTFDATNAWQQLGHDSMAEWLASPDVDLGRSWFYLLMDVWHQLVVNAGVDPESLRELNPSKLQTVLPAVRRKQITATRALADTKALSRNDLRELYGTTGASTTTTPEGARPDDTTAYDADSEPQYVRCPTCNSRVKEDDLR